MTGECYDGTRDFKWTQENLPYGGNLDVYEIETVNNSNAIEGQTPFDVIDETLYGKNTFKTLREKVDWICSNFAHTQKWIDDNEWLEKHKLED
jgi:adenine-specific DNA-methyltransferase